MHGGAIAISHISPTGSSSILTRSETPNLERLCLRCEERRLPDTRDRGPASLVGGRRSQGSLGTLAVIVRTVTRMDTELSFIVKGGYPVWVFWIIPWEWCGTECGRDWVEPLAA